MKKRKLLCLLLAVIMLLALTGCGRTVICDGCGEEIKVRNNSNITDEWIVYCKDCELELFGEDGLVS